MHETYALVFGYGQKENGLIDEQTEGRCEKAALLYKARRVRKIYVTASPMKAGLKMATRMFYHLEECGVDSVDVIVEPCGSNTAGEMDVFLSLIPSEPKIIFVSTWYHIPRIIWLAWRRMPSERFTVVASWKHANITDLLIEPLKIINAVFRPRSSARFA
ncbi:YdcF family protein [bacterium]|nr:YdcF family protein [bacterium]